MRKTLALEDPELARALVGEGDRHLRRVREALGVEVVVRKELLHLDGAEAPVNQGMRVFEDMLEQLREGRGLEAEDVDEILGAVLAEENNQARRPRRGRGEPLYGAKRRWEEEGEGLELVAGRVRPLTAGQRAYLEAIRAHDVVFSIGPAGTGKTYLAVAMAIDGLGRNQFHRLVLARPAVEAGEHLGFLPGDLREKVNPYLLPLYDSLHDLLSPAQVARFQERGVIEIAPLAFMRGRTLNNAFVILDEAQNTTPKQMKMFLTRLGRSARAVITGDVTQADLPAGCESGLIHAWRTLRGLEGVAFVRLERPDIVRHPLVQRIVEAYEREDGAGGRQAER